MTDKEFQEAMLVQVKSIGGRLDIMDTKFDTLEGKFDTFEGRFDTIEGKIDNISQNLQSFQSNQEEFNNAIWNMSNQAFFAINEIRQEVLPPWKNRKTKI